MLCFFHWNGVLLRALPTSKLMSHGKRKLFWITSLVIFSSVIFLFSFWRAFSLDIGFLVLLLQLCYLSFYFLLCFPFFANLCYCFIFQTPYWIFPFCFHINFQELFSSFSLNVSFLLAFCSCFMNTNLPYLSENIYPHGFIFVVQFPLVHSASSLFSILPAFYIFILIFIFHRRHFPQMSGEAQLSSPIQEWATKKLIGSPTCLAVLVQGQKSSHLSMSVHLFSSASCSPLISG